MNEIIVWFAVYALAMTGVAAGAAILVKLIWVTAKRIAPLLHRHAPRREARP